MNAAELRALMEELERIEKIIGHCAKVMAGRGRLERPHTGPTMHFFPSVSIPVSDAVAYMHLDCYLFDLEVRRDAIKKQLGVE